MCWGESQEGILEEVTTSRRAGVTQVERLRKGVPGGGNSICKDLEGRERDGRTGRHRAQPGVGEGVTWKSYAGLGTPSTSPYTPTYV